MSESIKQKIRAIPNWPKPGIMFRDVTTLFKDAAGFGEMVKLFVDNYQGKQIDFVAGIESRGFIIGAALAYALKTGFVPLRKKGKLPAETIGEEYQLEYGTDKIEIHKDALPAGARVLLVDDLIATGGTALAGCNLIKKAGGQVVECAFVVDLPDLGGSKRLKEAGYGVFCLVDFAGE